MSLTRKLVLGAVLPAALSPAVLVAAGSPAQAYETMCDPGWSWTTMSTPTRTNQITHVAIRENYTGSSATRTVTASRVSLISASVSTSSTISAELSGSIFKLFSAKASSSLGLTVAAKGSTTKTTGESVTWTMKPGDTYVFYSGSKKVSASWTRKRCNSAGTAVSVVASGTVKSFANNAEGAVGCKATPPAGTMAYSAKAKYC